MSEFKDCTVKEVENCIENNIQISSRKVFYSENTEGYHSEKISGRATEDKVPGDGNSYFDIIFDVYPPGNGRVKIIINIEAQKRFNAGYSLVTRGIFYGSRMIAAQLNKEFEQKNYDEIKKVYSIWICFDVPKEYGNTITKYKFSKEDVVGYVKDKPAEYDKMCITMVHLREKADTDNEFLKTMNILFSPKYKGNEKVDLLESQGVEMTRELKQEVGTMGNIIGLDTEKILEQGREEERVSMIREMYKNNVEIATIVKVCGLPENEVIKILRSNRLL